MALLKSKSKKDVGKKEEMEPSKQKQNIAVAYSMKRKSRKMAEGGEVDPPLVSEEEAKKFKEGANFSKGGEVANEKGPGADEDSDDFDELTLRDGLEFSETGKNSGDEDGGPSKKDLVSRAMLRKKR